MAIRIWKAWKEDCACGALRPVEGSMAASADGEESRSAWQRLRPQGAKLFTPAILLTLPVVLSSPAALAQESEGGQERQADVVALSSERSVLTPKGTLILEPSLSYTHSSSTEVAIEGYTIMPAIIVGLINVSELQRDSVTAAIGLRYGLTNRLEVELKVPYVYAREQVKEREIFSDSPTDLVRSSEGDGLGDIELGLRYQLNQGLGGWPYMVAGLRVKSRTGEDPFEVDREPLFLEDDDGNRYHVGDVYAEQPTGSGFWSVQPSLSFLYTTDPAVIYGSINYLWTLERDVGRGFGKIDPGDSVGLSLGMGFAINERASFSLGYDHSVVFETKREFKDDLISSFDRFHVGSLLLGFGFRAGPKSSLNLSMGIGVTEYAPDVQITLRMPRMIL